LDKKFKQDLGQLGRNFDPGQTGAKFNRKRQQSIKTDEY
jgi:hypothetical protein